MALEMWKKKAGPLPMWGWGGLGLGAALVYSFVKRGKSTGDSTDTGSQPTDTGTVPSDQVPDFISQVYTTVNNAAPEAPAAPPSPPAPPVKTTLPAPVSAPPIAPPKAVNPIAHPVAPVKTTAAKATSYKVKHGDSLSSIAKKYGTTWQALWAYNTTAGVRPADTIKTLKSRGPNLLYSGETILIPPKK